MSSRVEPLPSQASQRPPATLKLNRPAFQPRFFESGSIVKSLRMSSHTFTYVAGLLRGVRPIGDWSITITLSSESMPSIAVNVPVAETALPASSSSVGEPASRRRSSGSSTSPTSELLPLPDTPVTQTSWPSGISTSMPVRLLCRTP